ncbi:MAG TPA: XdhC family protein [Polyangiaceae bacterium]|jgi:xanthine/CO dehydrogenase XdhC/CoxF family maturation factor
MSELIHLIRSARDLRARGEPFAYATVVAVRGSSYRRPGARMILTADRWVAGSVSGGCLEGDLVRKLRWHLRGGRPVVLTFDATDGRLGCNGAVDVLLEEASGDERDPLVVAERCVREQKRVAIVTTICGDAIGSRVMCSAGVCAEADADHFVEAIVPPPRLFVLGASHDALPLVRTAAGVGWETFVCVSTARVATRERFMDACDAILSVDEAAQGIEASDTPLAVVMSHDFDADARSLAMLLRSRAGYIGVLGPRERTERLLAEIGAVDDRRIFSPIGLDLGADGPDEIALAIVAEARASLARSSRRSLRDRTPKRVEVA